MLIICAWGSGLWSVDETDPALMSDWLMAFLTLALSLARGRMKAYSSSRGLPNGQVPLTSLLPVVFLQPSSQLYHQPLWAPFSIHTFFRLLKGLAEAQWEGASGLTFITAAYPKFTGGRFRTTRLHGKIGSHSGFTAEKPATFRKRLVGFFFFFCG